MAVGCHGSTRTRRHRNIRPLLLYQHLVASLEASIALFTWASSAQHQHWRLAVMCQVGGDASHKELFYWPLVSRHRDQCRSVKLFAGLADGTANCHKRSGDILWNAVYRCFLDSCSTGHVLRQQACLRGKTTIAGECGTHTRKSATVTWAA